MEKVHLITYGDNHYNKTKHRLVQEAKRTKWFSTITAYDQDNMDDDYKEEFKEVLNQQRGSGYWIWKSYFILKRLKEIDEGDILIYLDAGCTIHRMADKRFYEYIRMLDTKCMIAFQMHHVEKHYTTKEIFEYFNVLEREDITETGQHLGGIRIMKNNQETRSIMQLEYDTYKANKLLVTDHYNSTQEPYFVDNRHEQSVFSVITKLNNNVMVLQDETDRSDRKIRKNFPFFASRIKDRNLMKRK
jgi:hypothetical protein